MLYGLIRKIKQILSLDATQQLKHFEETWKTGPALYVVVQYRKLNIIAAFAK